MTAIDLAFIFFIVSFTARLLIDFIADDKRAAAEARVRTTRKAAISAETIKSVNNYYRRPVNGKRAVRTSLSKPMPKRPATKAI